MLTTTAAVGQSVLRCAIGLHENYIRYESTDSPQEASALSGAQESLRKVYVNEKNRYGVRDRLNRNDILLFLLLHFNNPDHKGFIRLFNIEEAAETLNCHVRTIRNSLRRMAEAGYIAYQSALGVPFHYHIFLKEFSRYFAKASENGRGYIRISKEFFEGLVQNKTITSLRLAIRGFLFETDESARGNKNCVQKTYRDLRKDLPGYCHRKQIREAVNSEAFRRMYDVNDKKYTLYTALKTEFDMAHTIIKLKQEFGAELEEKIKRYNKTANKKYQFVISPSDFSDIVNIAQQFPSSIILAAIDEVIRDYVKTGMKIMSPGALVRAFTKRRAVFAA